MDCLGNQGLTGSGQFTSVQSVSNLGVGGGTGSTGAVLSQPVL